MLSKQEEMHERHETLENDRKLREQQREQGTTFHQFAQADAEIPGRYGAVSKAQIVGQGAAYPACSPALAVQLPDEPPLGLDNPALEPSAVSSLFSSAETTDPTPARTVPAVDAAGVGSTSQLKRRRL